MFKTFVSFSFEWRIYLVYMSGFPSSYSPKSSPRGARSPVVSRQDSTGTLKTTISLGKNPSIVHSGPFYLMKEPPCKCRRSRWSIAIRCRSIRTSRCVRQRDYPCSETRSQMSINIRLDETNFSNHPTFTILFVGTFVFFFFFRWKWIDRVCKFNGPLWSWTHVQ